MPAQQKYFATSFRGKEGFLITRPEGPLKVSENGQRPTNPPAAEHGVLSLLQPSGLRSSEDIPLTALFSSVLRSPSLLPTDRLVTTDMKAAIREKLSIPDKILRKCFRYTNF